MPPFVTTSCPACGKENRYDLAELRKPAATIYKGVIYRASEAPEEYQVTCQSCGQTFKISVSVPREKPYDPVR